MQKLFSNIFDFFFRKLTEFPFKYKKIAKIILNFFPNFLFEKFFSTFFFGEHFFYRIFFWRKFFFSQKYFCCIWCLRNKVFCEIFYSKLCLLRIFCFAILVYGKKIVNFFAIFFFSDEREYQIWKCFFSEKK